jgi:DNA-directed RNA polymerase specialized sigma24 family protein
MTQEIQRFWVTSCHAWATDSPGTLLGCSWPWLGILGPTQKIAVARSLSPVVSVSSTAKAAPVNTSNGEAEFHGFVARAEPRLHRALVARFGWEQGREATAEALAYAWEHWSTVRRLDNPVGYLFRVGQSRSRVRKKPILFARPDAHDQWYEPELARLLGELPSRQRVAVVLVHGYGWTTREVAELLGVRATTVQTHLSRGLIRLREELEVSDCV